MNAKPTLARLQSRPEAVGAAKKVLLEDRVEQFHRGPLHDLVFQGGDGNRALAPILLGDVDPAQRLCAVGLALQLLVQLDEILNQVLLVLRTRHSIHSGGGVLA